MATKFKVIKATDFQHEGNNHTNYTLAYQGRVLQLSTFNWEADNFEVDTVNKTLTVKKSLEVGKKESIDIVTGVKSTNLIILPKCDLDLAIISN